MSAEFDTYIDHAIRWAMEALGSTEYKLLCLKFVEDAYELSNGIVLAGYRDAKETADAYGAEGNRGVPPRGAYVLYDCWGTIDGKYRNWGHVGLSIGEGKVIHAWDKVRIDDYLAIQDLEAGPGWTKLEYVGWASVPRIMEGMGLRGRS